MTIVSLISSLPLSPRASTYRPTSLMRRRPSASPGRMRVPPAQAAVGGAPLGLGVALSEAARKQKDIFDGVLREAAKHLLGGAEIPSRNVELGRLGLRYRREAHGGIGWLR